ncbi:MAG: HEAT repeat domain-containing protein [Verrucomicrobiota bacterium]
MQLLKRVLLTSTAVLLVAGCGKHRETVKQVEKLVENKSYNEAMDVLQQALQQDPESKPLLQQYVLLFLHVENLRYTTAAYRRLTATHPGDPVLIESVSHPNPVVRVTAAKALGFFKDANAIKALSEASKDPEKSVRRAAVLALGELEQEEVIPALVSALDDSYWYIRAEAALALGKIGDAQSASRLFSMLQDSDPYVRENVQQALQDLASEVNQSAYLGALNSDIPKTRLVSAIALAYAGNAAGTQVLVTELSNPDSTELLSVIQAAAALEEPELLPALRNLMEHEDKNVAAHAILALGELDDIESVQRIKTKLQSKSEPKIIKTACLMALNMISQ